MSKEIKNTEIVAEETEVVAVPEEKKDGKVKKVWNAIKTNAPKVIVPVVVGVGAFLLGAHVAGKSEDDDYVEGIDVIEANDFTVEDAE